MKGSGLQGLVCTVQGAGNCCVPVCSALRDKTEKRLLGRHLSKKGVKLLKMKDRRGGKKEKKEEKHNKKSVCSSVGL